MYLPKDPNSVSREISSRRRSVAASLSLFQKPFTSDQQLSDTSDGENKSIKDHGPSRRKYLTINA